VPALGPRRQKTSGVLIPEYMLSFTKRIRASPRSTNATSADPKPYGIGERGQHSSGACHVLSKRMALHRTKGGMHLIGDCTCKMTNSIICAGARCSLLFQPTTGPRRGHSKKQDRGDCWKTGDKTGKITRQIQVDWQSHLHTCALAGPQTNLYSVGKSRVSEQDGREQSQ
jgi:hypothetical protein